MQKAIPKIFPAVAGDQHHSAPVGESRYIVSGSRQFLNRIFP